MSWCCIGIVICNWFAEIMIRRSPRLTGVSSRSKGRGLAPGTRWARRPGSFWGERVELVGSFTGEIELDDVGRIGLADKVAIGKRSAAIVCLGIDEEVGIRHDQIAVPD